MNPCLIRISKSSNPRSNVNSLGSGTPKPGRSFPLTDREIDKVYDTICSCENLEEQLGLYFITIMTEWDCRQECSNEQEVIAEKRRVYLHVFFNIEKTADDEATFGRKILTL